MSSIMTNKVIFQKNYNEIDKKYDIICIKTSGKYFRFNSVIFDMPLLNKNVRSVLYSDHALFLLVNKAAENLSVVMSGLKDTKESDNLSGRALHSSEIEDYQLLQLLLNSLWNFNIEGLKANNVTGHLYYFKDEWCHRGLRELKNEIIKVSCIEVKIDNEMHINLPVRTFTSGKLKQFIHFGKTKYEDYPKYILNANGTLTRKRNEDDGPEYIMRNSGRKREVPFLDISSYKKFTSSKMGILYQTIDRFNTVYDGLASIQLEQVPLSVSIESHRPEINRKRAERDFAILNQNINIIDLAKDADSQKTVEVVVAAIHEGFDEKDSLFTTNVVETDRPEEGKLNIVVLHEKEYYDDVDPYSERFPGCIIQHVTVEKANKNTKHIIRTIANELLIKQDILNKRITLFDWPAMNYSGNVTFITKTKDDDENRYHLMIVHPDGSFDFVEKKDFEQIDKYTTLLDYFLIDEHIDNLIIDSENNVVSIWDTGWYTIPNIKEIASYLKEGNTKLKGKEKRQELLEAVTDIRSFEQNGDTYYYVGVIGDGMQSKVANASHIREFETVNGNDLYDSIQIMMDTQIVRNGQYTVIPFPFKYIRESRV